MQIGFRPSVAGMNLSGPHTIEKPEEYLQDNLGQDTLDWLRQGQPAVIAVGEGGESLRQLQSQGWSLGQPVEKAVGFHQVRNALTSEGRPVKLIWRVNGEDRTDHIQSLLRLAGATSEQVYTVGQSKRYKEEYLEKFRSLGPPPDLVVYGMAKTAAAAVLGAHPLRNLKELWNLFRRRGAPEVGKSLSQSDMAGLKMEIMSLKDGKKIWFLPPLYGDLSLDLLDALLEHGCKKLNFVGTAGGVDPSLKVGQVVTPDVRLGPDGAAEKLDWLVPTAGCDSRGTYQRVVTPNEETRQWALQRDAAGVDLVEVELGHWLDRLRHRPDVQLRVQTVISDVLQGPNHQDMTEWNSWDTFKVHDPILTGIQEALGKNSDLRVERYQSSSMIP